MLILHNDQLLHVDSSRDVLEHYGVKGMKWGKRLKSALSNIYDNHKENLKYKYRQKGLSEKEVNERLSRRLRNEKIAAVALGTAATAYAAYKGGKYVRDEFLGTTFKKGDKIKTVMANDIDYNRHFYAANKKGDHLKYKALRGRDLENYGGRPSVVTTEFLSNAKIAPNRVARREFNDLYKNNPSFRNTVDTIERRQPLFGLETYKNKYDKFNALAPYDSDSTAWNKYKSRINKRGFIGIQDVNDKNYSGYLADNPIIVFGKEGKMRRSKISAYKVNDDDFNKEMGKIVTRSLIKGLSVPGAVVGSLSTVNKYRKNKKRREADITYNKKYSKKV